MVSADIRHCKKIPELLKLKPTKFKYFLRFLLRILPESAPTFIDWLKVSTGLSQIST
jgi:hypothetical protein